MLLDYYGPQGWWPLISTQLQPARLVYHPRLYSLPETEAQQLEICFGAILGQNTNWSNASRALSALFEISGFELDKITSLSTSQLETAIRPAGYFRQKTHYIQNLTEFLRSYPLNTIKKMKLREIRPLLLSVKGVGAETADSILLYALERCSFVVDAYATRIAVHLDLIPPTLKYQEIKEFFEKSLPEDLVIYQEFHALLVMHGKSYFSRKPYAVDDPVLTSTSSRGLYES